MWLWITQTCLEGEEVHISGGKRPRVDEHLVGEQRDKSSLVALDWGPVIDKAFIKLSLALESPWCLRYRDIKTCRAVGEKSHAGSVCSLAIGPLQGWTSGLPLLFHRLYPEDRGACKAKSMAVLLRLSSLKFPSWWNSDGILSLCDLIFFHYLSEQTGPLLLTVKSNWNFKTKYEDLLSCIGNYF